MTRIKLIEEFKKLGLNMNDKNGGNYYEVRKDGVLVYSFSTIKKGFETLQEEKIIQKNLIKIKLDNMSEHDKVDYINHLELEENKIYNAIEHDKDYYKLIYGAKRGLWINKKVCSIVE